MGDRRPRMLVVDDERHIVDLVAMGLEGHEMDVEGLLKSSDTLLAVMRSAKRVYDSTLS